MRFWWYKYVHIYIYYIIYYIHILRGSLEYCWVYNTSDTYWVTVGSVWTYKRHSGDSCVPYITYDVFWFVAAGCKAVSCYCYLDDDFAWAFFIPTFALVSLCSHLVSIWVCYTRVMHGLSGNRVDIVLPREFRPSNSCWYLLCTYWFVCLLVHTCCQPSDVS